MNFSTTFTFISSSPSFESKSQKEVATALKMDASQYSCIESGKTDPSFTIVVKIAKALGVTLSELLYR